MQSFQKALFVRLFAALALLITLGWARGAHACNPYQVTFKTSVAPENPALGNLWYSIQSTCPMNPDNTTGPHACGGSFAIPPFTPVAQKCALFAAAIKANPACKRVDTLPIPAGVHTGFVVDDTTCATTASFTVSDPACTTQGTAADGVLMGISSANDIIRSAPTTTATVDYEFDTITPGCQATGNGDIAICKNSASGQSISGDPQSSVFGSIMVGGFATTVRVNTRVGDPPRVVLGALASQLNQQGAGATCELVFGRVLQCKTTSGGLSVPLTVQVDDTAIVRLGVSGPPSVVQKLAASVDTPTAPLFSEANFVAAAGTPAPALPAWAFALLVLALLCVAGAALYSRVRPVT